MCRDRGRLSAMAWTPLLSAAALALWPTASLAANGAADYFVHHLPGIPHDSPPIKMHAGHIEVAPENNGNLFFWHFQNRHIAYRQRTVIWVNGGPGCSSEDGALMEVGPYRVKDQDTLVLNNGSWNEFANLLFVDNPVGTGFSYADTNSYLRELGPMAVQFTTFLDKFFTLFPEYEQDDIYIAGESYAGQHIPYIAQEILNRNKKKDAQSRWRLKGLLIGNGWISPRQQYESYIPFALRKGLIEKDSDKAKQLQHLHRICDRKLSTEPGHVDYRECEAVLSAMLKLTRTKSGDDHKCYNMYDVRLRDSFPSCGMNWPPDLSTVTPYLRQTKVTEALHINPQRNTGWQECNGAVGAAFKAKNSKPAIDLLPDLIKEVPILLFSGSEDLICNYIGTEQLISSMEWNGGKGFEVTPGNWAPRRDWTFEGEVAGFWQEARNLTYVHFYNASHMVPFDHPRRSRDMLDRFMKVDISSIGGEPTDSRIDGEKGPETSVGGAANKTSNAHHEAEKIDEAKWAAYQRSGEVVLVIVILAAGGWAYFLWRQRRGRASYRVLGEDDGNNGGGTRLHVFSRRQGEGDLEAAAFDERQVDDLEVESPNGGNGIKMEILGVDSDGEAGQEEGAKTTKRAGGEGP